MVLCDSISAHHPVPSGSRSCPFKPQQKRRHAKWSAFRPMDRRALCAVRPGIYSHADFDFKKPATPECAKLACPAQRKHKHAKYEIFDYPGGFVENDHGDRAATRPNTAGRNRLPATRLLTGSKPTRSPIQSRECTFQSHRAPAHGSEPWSTSYRLGELPALTSDEFDSQIAPVTRNGNDQVVPLKAAEAVPFSCELKVYRPSRRRPLTAPERLTPPRPAWKARRPRS